MNERILFIVLAWFALLAMSLPGAAEEFPTANEWAMTDAGFSPGDIESVMTYARENLSSGVVIVKDGRIFAERYWPLPAEAQGNFMFEPTEEGYPREDVASVQKSVTATLAMIAREKGLIDFDEAVAKYLGDDWADVTPAQSRKITLWHLMSMTSGLDRRLAFDAEPGEKWAYNTAAYQRLLRVLEVASGMEANELTKAWLTGPIGMQETAWVARAWTAAPDMMGLVTTPRDLARFGLLILNEGRWGEQQILSPASVREMTVPSQTLNPAYGLLWWLNRDEGYMTPAGERDEGRRVSAAPTELLTAAGALGRFVYIVPSARLVIVRTGGNPTDENFRNAWWTHLSRLLGAS